MAANARSMGIGEFESNCGSLLDEVAATGETLIVTRAGKPLAKVVPFEKPRPLLGSVLWEKDIVSPMDEPWDAEF
jgi:prevent-host-death family protein